MVGVAACNRKTRRVRSSCGSSPQECAAHLAPRSRRRQLPVGQRSAHSDRTWREHRDRKPDRALARRDARALSGPTAQALRDARARDGDAGRNQMKRVAAIALRALLVLTAALALTSCADRRAELKPVPTPDVSAFEPSVRNAVTTARATFD